MLFAFLLSFLAAFSSSKSPLKFNTDLIVTDNLKADSVQGNTLNTADDANVQITKEISSGDISTEALTSEEIQTEKIIAKDSNNAIIFTSNILLSNDIMTDSKLNINTNSYSVNGVNQWVLKHHDNFDNEESLKGWNNTRTNTCDETSKNYHLGGFCNTAGEEVVKTYKIDVPHKKLRISALYHMIDSWNGEIGYMKVDGVKVWQKRGYSNNTDKGLNVCGGEANDAGFNEKIDIIIKHNSDKVTIAFGSTLDDSPCEHSYGVDDVMIYSK